MIAKTNDVGLHVQISLKVHSIVQLHSHSTEAHSIAVSYILMGEFNAFFAGIANHHNLDSFGPPRDQCCWVDRGSME